MLSARMQVVMPACTCVIAGRVSGAEKKSLEPRTGARYGERCHHFRLGLHLHVIAFVPFQYDVLVEGCMWVT
jgi:hypothetical protein